MSGDARDHDGGDAATRLSADRLLGGRVRLRQPERGLRTAIDAVLLAAAVPARGGDRVLDVGCGAGAAALCLAARVAGLHIRGIERDPHLAALAADNAAANGLATSIEVLCADIADGVPRLAGGFDQVMTNPPYRRAESGRLPADPARRAAAVEDAPDLAGWLAFCCRMLAARGTLTLIHRADRLAEIVASLHGRLGGLAVLPLWPGGARGGPARRVVVQGRRGSRAPFRLLPGLTLHRADGGFTAAAEAILRDAAPLAWDDR